MRKVPVISALSLLPGTIIGYVFSDKLIEILKSPLPTKDPLENLFNKFDKFQDFKDHMESLYIAHKLKMNNWNVSKTSDEIDIQRSHLYNKIEKYNLKREEAAGS